MGSVPFQPIDQMMAAKREVESEPVEHDCDERAERSDGASSGMSFMPAIASPGMVTGMRGGYLSRLLAVQSILLWYVRQR